MRHSLKNKLSVLGRMKTFGPAKQSFTIRNDSEKQANIFCECLGNKGFKLSDASQKLTIKPRSSARIHISYQAQALPCVMTLTAKYKAVINVWVMDAGEGSAKKLVNVQTVSAIGPGYVSCHEVKCFDPIGSPKQHVEAGTR